MSAGRAIVSAVVFLLTAVSQTTAENLLYQKKAGNEVSLFSVIIEKTRSGYALTAGAVRDGQFTLEVTMLTDDRLATRQWRYVDPKAKLELEAVRDGNRIELTGVQNGLKVKRSFPIDDKPWLQFFPFGLEEFALSQAASTEFWAVSPELLTCGLLSATKKSFETVMCLGRVEHAVRTRIALAAPLSTFWGADFWLSTAHGRYLRFEGTNGPGTPETTIELIERRD